MPKGVEVKKLRDICENRSGVRVVKKQLSDNDGYPVYQNSLTSLGMYQSDCEICEEFSHQRVIISLSEAVRRIFSGCAAVSGITWRLCGYSATSLRLICGVAAVIRQWF